MSNFKNNTSNFGQVKSGNKLSATYEVTSDKELERVISTCSCLTSKIERGSKKFEMYHTVSSIPHHLAIEGVTELPQTKKVTAVFTDGSKEEVYMKFIIVK